MTPEIEIAAQQKTLHRRLILRRGQLVILLLLLAQLVLGMFVNLFVTVPTVHPGAKASAYFSGSVQSVAWAVPHGGLWLTAHASLGLVLVLVAIWLLIVALRADARGGRTTAIIGGVAVLGAGFNGASFLDYNEDVSSMIMSGLAALAMAAYVVGLFLNQAWAGFHSDASAAVS